MITALIFKNLQLIFTKTIHDEDNQCSQEKRERNVRKEMCAHDYSTFSDHDTINDPTNEKALTLIVRDKP